MSDSQELKIIITAKNETDKAWEDVVNGAQKIKPALDDAAKSANTTADALGRFQAGEPGSPATGANIAGLLKEDLNGLTPALDDTAVAATEAIVPIDGIALSFDDFGNAIKQVGQAIPGTLGTVTEGMGRVASASEKVGTVLEAVVSGATKVVTALGPVGMVSAVGAAGISALYLTGILGGSSGLEGKLDDIRDASDEASASINKVAFSMDDAATGFALFQTSAKIDKTVDDLTRLYEITQVFQGENAAGEFASGTVEGINSYNEAGAEARRIADDLGIAWTNSEADLTSLQSTIEATTEQQDLFNTIMSHAGPGAADAQARLAELNAAYANGSLTLEEYNWQVQWITDNLVLHYDTVAAAEAAQRQFAESAFASAEAVGLLDSALELMNAAGVETEATMAAMALTGSALDSTFGTIVGTTDRLAAGTEAVSAWAESLTEAADGISVIGQAYAEGRITLEQYSAGVSAAISIQEDNAIVQAEIQAIQAQHLPLMASLTEQQRSYIEGLGDLSAQQQIAALGFMDSAQSARAMELATLAAKAANGELGDTGEATANRIIASAAQADPVMKQMLLDMGLISEGADGTITVNFPNAAGITASVDSLKLSIDALTVALGGIPPSVNTNITASDSATPVIATVRNALSLLNGQTSTVYINTVRTGSGPLVLGEDAGLHGGVMGYDDGGVVARMGEAGPELLGFPNGSRGIVLADSYYNVPPGTSVLPAPATRDILDKARGGSGGATYNGPVYQTVRVDDSRFARRAHDLRRSRG